jgi:hypothetical protein
VLKKFQHDGEITYMFCKKHDTPSNISKRKINLNEKKHSIEYKKINKTKSNAGKLCPTGFNKQ